MLSEKLLPANQKEFITLKCNVIVLRAVRKVEMLFPIYMKSLFSNG